MRKLISIMVLLFFVLSISAKDTVSLTGRRRVEGSLVGVAGDYVVMRTDDDIVAYYPKRIVKSIYRGRTNITVDVFEQSPKFGLDQLSMEGLSVSDSLLAISQDNQEIGRHLSAITHRLTMIAIPMWISICAGIVALISAL